MEEVNPPQVPDPGQFSAELPEPLNTPNANDYPAKNVPPQPVPHPYQANVPPVPPPIIMPERQPMSIPNYQDPNNVNTLPNPVETGADPNTPESEFDKRRERIPTAAIPKEEAMDAGMVALGDVLKKRTPPMPQAPYQAPMVPPYPQPSILPTPAQNGSTGASTSLYKQAIAVGVTAALIIAPVLIYFLVNG